MKGAHQLSAFAKKPYIGIPRADANDAIPKKITALTLCARALVAPFHVALTISKMKLRLIVSTTSMHLNLSRGSLT